MVIAAAARTAEGNHILRVICQRHAERFGDECDALHRIGREHQQMAKAQGHTGRALRHGFHPGPVEPVQLARLVDAEGLTCRQRDLARLLDEVDAHAVGIFEPQAVGGKRRR